MDWISVVDRLPEPPGKWLSVAAIVTTEDGQVVAARYRHPINVATGWRSYDDNWPLPYGVTHWMPFPAAATPGGLPR